MENNNGSQNGQNNNVVKSYSKEGIQELLGKNDMAVVRGIEALYLRQTEDEKASDTTSHRNGRGFNGTDAFILSRFAVRIAEWRAEKVANGRTRFPFPLSTREGGQLALARKKIMKYAGQLADIANAKAAATQNEAAVEAAAERAAIQAAEIEDDAAVVVFDEFESVEVEDEYLSLA